MLLNAMNVRQLEDVDDFGRIKILYRSKVEEGQSGRPLMKAEVFTLPVNIMNIINSPPDTLRPLRRNKEDIDWLTVMELMLWREQHENFWFADALSRG